MNSESKCQVKYLKQTPFDSYFVVNKLSRFYNHVCLTAAGIIISHILYAN